MAAPVWNLSINLETKTAVFTTGLADAARSARESFKGIGDGAKGMADDVGGASASTGYSMMEARHGVMMLGEEFGIHLPRGITTFIASLGPVGAAMEAAFPFLAIILGATLLIEHLVKIGEAAEKAAEAGSKLGEDMTLGGNKAKEALLAAQMEADKLAGRLPDVAKLNEMLQLKGTDEGIHNVERLSKQLDELVKAHGATSNWNPFNWLDNSDDLQNKIKFLKESLKGPDGDKSDKEQMGIMDATLAAETRRLGTMREQGEASKAQVANEAAYVDWLQKASKEMHDQQGAEAQQGSNKNTKDRQNEEAAQEKLAEAQQRGLDHRMQIEREYTKHRAEEQKKQIHEAEKMAEEELHATEAVAKQLVDQEKERAHIAEELGNEDAQRILKMAALTYQATEAGIKEEIKAHKLKGQQIVDAETEAENALFAVQIKAEQEKLAALDKYDKNLQVKLKQIQDKEEELAKAHQNKLTQINLSAEEERDARILSARHKADNEIAQSMSKVLEGNESFGKSMRSIGQQVASGMLENALKSIMANDMTKESDAAKGARSAYNAFGGIPIVGPILGAAAAATTFAMLMAFEGGGIVPGVERGDVVPARLTPGEAILPKSLTEGLTNAAKTGSMSGSNGDVHFHYHPTQHFSALDSSGMEGVLNKHADVIERHVTNAFRKRNL